MDSYNCDEDAFALKEATLDIKEDRGDTYVAINY
jgi:hypothetical protein